ncbi:LOW QUALITY PROTEIN: choline transporter, putative [Aspergillus lentulus]|nr:LOW QUALITY PROTEIN: choline transporter, putative [Aspergillus lentulus]
MTTSFSPSETGSPSPDMLTKNFSRISLLGLAFITLNAVEQFPRGDYQLLINTGCKYQSWTAFASALSLSLTSGGPTSIIWGTKPFSPGYKDLRILTHPRTRSLDLGLLYTLYRRLSGRISIRISYRGRFKEASWATLIFGLGQCRRTVPLGGWRVLSWVTAWANVTAWICLCATASLFGSQLVIDIVILAHPEFNLQRWHVFLIYVGFNMIALLVNAFWNRILSALNRAALIWSLCGFSIIFVTVLACASPNYNSARFVFTSFINETGWPDGLAWLLGLLQGGLCLVGVDAVAHMIEEIPKPTVDGPLIMVACVAIGLTTSLILIIALLFVSRDIDTIITSGAGPLLQIFFDATNSEVGSICLLVFVSPRDFTSLCLTADIFFLQSSSFPIGCLLLGVVAITTTSSRMIYALARYGQVSNSNHALARDSGLPFSSVWTTFNARLKTPVNSLALNTAAVICCGFIFLGSSSAFNALSSATVICFDISYCLPILIHCIRGRKLLPMAQWSLYPVVGWIVNIVSIVYISFTTVLFIFPPARPVTGSTMSEDVRARANFKNLTNGRFCCLVDYAIAATGGFALLSAIDWFARGQKRFMQIVVNAETEFPQARTSISPIKPDV